MQQFDWSKTELGPRSRWPHTLSVAVDLVLGVPCPMLLAWGANRIIVFNEAYAALSGSRHTPVPGGNVPALWPAALSACPHGLEEALRGFGSVQRHLPVAFIRESGVEVLPFDLHFTALADEQGQVRGATCALAPSVQPERTSDSGMRVLVVEDNLDSQYLVCEMLRTFGHTVEGVSHGEDALARLAVAPFDVLFSDVSLPGISGVELARRGLALYPRLRVVFATGYGERLLSQVEFPHRSLQKPYDLEQLQRVLEEIRETLQA